MVPPHLKSHCKVLSHKEGVVALWSLHSSLPHGLQISNPSMIHLMLYANARGGKSQDVIGQ
jgi:hypothetical protein